MKPTEWDKLYRQGTLRKTESNIDTSVPSIRESILVIIMFAVSFSVIAGFFWKYL